MNSSAMRGLSVFISDLRNCRSREEEEKRINKELGNIRSKFKESGLNGYHKKKYVCKLLYIYLLGYEIDFGHVEAVNLITTNKYSEKQIGYLAVTLLLTENHDLVRLVINSMKKDLEDFHETFNCLALQSIANLGGREVAESLTLDVFKLLVAGNSPNFVKKKAALCLLRLFRKHPDVMPINEWAEKIISTILDDFDMGVITSGLSLMIAMALSHPDLFAPAVPKAIHKLSKVILEKEFTPDNVYYSVPVPWLQIKILRLLQIYPAPTEKSVRDKLYMCLNNIFSNANDSVKNVQQNNAVNAILFEAINLVVLIDPECEFINQSANLLCRYLSSKESNLRYMGLEALSQLTIFPQCLEIIKKHQDTIFVSLKDKDVSVRKRALDLLYAMCDTSNSKPIVTELLQQMAVADFAMKEEMVLKIAILTEKFAADPTWYVDVMFKLISAAGEHVPAEVWYRVIQIITNDETLRQYAAKDIYVHLKQNNINEILVKVGGYILGEYGDLIVNEPGCAPLDQFNALHSKYGICSPSTRAVLLTTYAKFINIFPEIKRECMSVLQQHKNVLDCELQQRACEYIALAQLPSDELLQTVFEPVPAFPDRESAVIQRLKKQAENSDDKRVLAKLESLDASAKDKPATGPKTADLLALDTAPKPSGLMDDLLGLVDSGSTPASVSKEQIETWYNGLMQNPSGIFYEDPNFQIGIKTEYSTFNGKLSLFFGNKASSTMQNVNVAVQPAAGLQIALTTSPLSSIAGKSQVVQTYQVVCTAPFSGFTHVSVTFTVDGQNRGITDLKFPLIGTKFSEPISMKGEDFINKWKQIGGGPKESQEIVKTTMFKRPEELKTLISALNFSIIEGIDQNPANICAATVLHCQGGKVGNLVRIESNGGQMMYRITVRGTNDAYVIALKDVLKQQLK